MEGKMMEERRRKLECEGMRSGEIRLETKGVTRLEIKRRDSW